MKSDINIKGFVTLLKAGLWGIDARFSCFSSLDYSEVYRLAEEQSVIGLVAAGLEHVVDAKVPKEYALLFAGSTLQLEQRNNAMNDFIGALVERLRESDIYTLLIKGQGIAQCYERPLWRAGGDVDLFLSADNYLKAKQVLIPTATSVEPEDEYSKHIGMIIGSWEVELHGNLRTGITKKNDKVLDDIQDDIFYRGNVRSWMNGNTQVFLPSADNDVVYVFSHILQHFFKGGIGLRQICDWCRILWTYKGDLDRRLLKERIREMGVMTEWKSFAALAVNILGMPSEAMPLYSTSRKWSKKGDRILSIILETGNFGHNRDESYLHNYSGIKRKVIRFSRITGDTLTHLSIFPLDSVRVWWSRMRIGLNVLIKDASFLS